MVSLNLENNQHILRVGNQNLSQVNETLHSFSNIGQGYWAVTVDHMMYDDEYTAKLKNDLPVIK
jgi:hypothetical protein